MSKSDKSTDSPTPVSRREWTFFSNHAHVLYCLFRDSSLTLREVSMQVGITERAVQRIVADLEQADVVQRERQGRRNHYRLQLEKPLRHPLEAHCSIGALLRALDDHAPD